MSTNLHPSKQVKTSSQYTIFPTPQIATTAPQTQLSPGMPLMFPGGSPNFVQDIKMENGFMDVDSRSSQCPSVERNFASPRSNCSTVDSIPPMQLGQNQTHLYLPDATNFAFNGNFASPQSNCSTVDSIPPFQIGQRNNHLYLPENSNFPVNGCSPTHFSGGTMTPINNNNNILINNNNNDFLSQKMSAISIPPQGDFGIKQVYQQTQQFLPQSQPESIPFLAQSHPEQSQYQQQQQQPPADEPIQSFSDLISSVATMPIDNSELIQDIEAELNSLGIQPFK